LAQVRWETENGGRQRLPTHRHECSVSILGCQQEFEEIHIEEAMDAQGDLDLRQPTK
jgi:hypothetical protein